MQLDLAQVRTRQVRLNDLGAPQVRAHDLLCRELGARQVGPLQVGAREVHLEHRAVRDHRPPQNATSQTRGRQVHVDEPNPGQVGPREVEACEVDSTNLRSGQGTTLPPRQKRFEGRDGLL